MPIVRALHVPAEPGSAIGEALPPKSRSVLQELRLQHKRGFCEAETTAVAPIRSSLSRSQDDQNQRKANSTNQSEARELLH